MADIVSQVTEKLKLSADNVDKAVRNHPLGKKVADAVPVRPAYLVAGLAAALCIIILVGAGQNAFANLVGFVYPVYASIKAIRTKQSAKDDTQWLTYWVVYSCFTVVESFTDLLLNWIPAYYLMKAGFLMWCFLDRTQGATIIYNLATPFLDKLVPAVDDMASKASQAAAKATQSAQNIAAATVQRTTSTNTAPKSE